MCEIEINELYKLKNSLGCILLTIIFLNIFSKSQTDFKFSLIMSFDKLFIILSDKS